MSKLADWLESGELTGVKVTEEISRLDREVTSSPHQDKADALCKTHGSLETLKHAGAEKKSPEARGERKIENMWREEKRKK